MPFQVVRQITHMGDVSSDERFKIVMGDGAILIGGVAFTEYPQTAFCLHKDYWPDAVVAARDELLAELQTTHPQHNINIDHFMAWIRTEPVFGSPNELVVGMLGLTVVVRFGVWREGKSISYASPIIELSPLP